MLNIEDIFMYYDVDDQGNVYSKWTKRFLKIYHTKKGYCIFGVTLPGRKSCPFRVHRMVAYKYIPNPNNYPYINHKDLNKSNNRADNLEWCTPQMNVDHALKNGVMKWKCGEDNLTSRLKNAEVVSIRFRLQSGESYRTVYEDYKDRIGWWSFRDICRGKAWVGV